jgi:predicted PurR-regulated permease PerM
MNAGAVGGAQTTDASTGGRIALLVRAVVQGGSVIVETVVAVTQSLAAVAVVVALSTLLAFYLLRDGDRAWGRILARTRGEITEELDGAARRAVDVLGGYMIGTGVISFVGAASQLVIMLLLGIPLAVPVFVLSFILCFIPYIGGFISTGLALLLTIAFGSPEAIAVMVVWTVVFNLVTGNIVSPLVYGKTVHLHPAIVLVAIPAGAAVAGILGMFVVVPALGVVAATWRSVIAIIGQRRRELEPGGSPAPEPPLPDEPEVVAMPGDALPAG